MRQSGWRFPPERRAALTGSGRREWLPPEPILRAVGAKAGETAVDVGVGMGFWTEPLSEFVGSTGRVLAVDVEPIMLDEVRTLAAQRNLTNVEVVHSDDASIPLNNGIADLVVLGFVLHEPENVEAFLAEVVRILKATGRVLVVEWQTHPTDSGPPPEVRISVEEARALLGAAGLTVERLESPTDDVYILVGREFHPGDPQMTIPTA